jgi:hypothetical protein
MDKVPLEVAGAPGRGRAGPDHGPKDRPPSQKKEEGEEIQLVLLQLFLVKQLLLELIQLLELLQFLIIIVNLLVVLFVLSVVCL